MSATCTSYLGPLGSLIHHFRADARTVAALAGLDLTRRFRRVWLDAIRGVVVLMSPSGRHERLTRESDDLVDAAADRKRLTVTKLGSTRWRRPDEPPGTGAEPDCCFYVGERADAYLAGQNEGPEAEDAFFERNAPDLVVEVEVTHADEEKVNHYSDLGVREFWRLDADKARKKPLGVEIFAPHRDLAPQRLPASRVLSGLTPDDVREAIEKLRRTGSRKERTKIVDRIVERREQDGLPAEEERAPYGARRVADRRPEVSTSYRGPLGSTIHHLRLDAETITALAGLDWDTRFRRVWLDPGRELVVLMEPSPLHDDLAGAASDFAESAAKARGRDAAPLRDIRWRREGEPPDTGIEPDCSFYLGERAEGYREALAEGEEAAAAFVERTPPALVVEVEMTRADEGKIARYAELGVRELWRVQADPGEGPLRADFLALHRGSAPRPLPASEVLPGLAPEEVAQAVEPAQPGRDFDGRSAAARPVRRGGRSPREQPAPYGMGPAEVEPVAAAAGLPRNR